MWNGGRRGYGWEEEEEEGKMIKSTKVDERILKD